MSGSLLFQQPIQNFHLLVVVVTIVAQRSRGCLLILLFSPAANAGQQVRQLLHEIATAAIPSPLVQFDKQVLQDRIVEFQNQPIKARGDAGSGQLDALDKNVAAYVVRKLLRPNRFGDSENGLRFLQNDFDQLAFPRIANLAWGDGGCGL
jgi:hypothetical protein